MSVITCFEVESKEKQNIAKILEDGGFAKKTGQFDVLDVAVQISAFHHLALSKEMAALYTWLNYLCMSLYIPLHNSSVIHPYRLIIILYILPYSIIFVNIKKLLYLDNIVPFYIV